MPLFLKNFLICIKDCIGNTYNLTTMANKCVTGRVKINNDSKGNIEKALSVIGNDIQRDVIALHINIGLFKHWLVKNNYLTQNSDIYDTNVNTLKSWIRKYNDSINNKVENHDSATHADTLNGFEKHAIKEEALSYTGDLIIDYLTDSVINNKNKTKNDIIKNVISDIRNELNNRAKTVIEEKFSKYKDEFYKLQTAKDNAKENYVKLCIDKNNNVPGITSEMIESAISQTNTAIQDLVDFSIKVLNEDNNTKNKNYIILYDNVISNPKWFAEVLNKQKMLTIQKLFNRSLKDEQWDELNPEVGEDSNAFFEEIGEDLKDYTSKAWEDAISSSYLKYFNSRLSLYLSNLYNRDVPVSKDENQNDKRGKLKGLSASDYLGVPTKMDARYVIEQICRVGVGSSVKEFVNSVERLANSAQSLYGVGALVNKMRSDNNFALFIFNQFRKPLVAKTMVILNETGIDFAKTNREAFGLEKLLTLLINDSNYTCEEVFNNQTKSKLNSLKYKILNLSNDAFVKSPVRDEITNKLKDYMSINFPNIKKEWIEQSLYRTNTNAKENTIKFIDILVAYENGIENTNKKITEAKNKYKAKLIAWDESMQFGEFKPKPEFEYSDEFYKQRNSTLIDLASFIYDCCPINTRQNSSNAEGHMSSDLLKCSYLTNFIDRVRTSLQNGENGIEVLKDFLTKSKFDRGEYWYSTIIFGIPGVKQGMFTKTQIPNRPTEYKINRQFFNGFNISLFNGNKDNIENSGVQYENMTASDFLMAQIKAFDSHIDVEGRPQGSSDGFMNILMRIPSDASNTYMIQVPRFKYNDFYKDIKTREINRKSAIFLGFKQNLIGEINEFVNQLNVVFEKDKKGTYVLKKDTKNLFNILHLNNGSLVEDGQLAGEVFKFKKLFDINNTSYSVNDEIIKALNIYGNSNSLVVANKKGELKLNINHSYIKENNNNGNNVLQYQYVEDENIDNIVEQWLKHYIDYIYYEANNHKNIVNNDLNNVNFEDFVLNTTLAYMEFDDIFEGSSKYYKDAQTFLKRAKETQMGGSVYGAYNFSNEIGGELTDALDANGNTIDVPGFTGITYINGKYKTGTLKLRNGFRAVTVYNTIGKTDSNTLERMHKDIYDRVLKDTNNEKIAKEVADEIANGYGRSYTKIVNGKEVKKEGNTTKYNDAQSYITFEEFVRRKIADGTYEEYKDLIKQLNDDNVKLSDINRDKLNKFVQVQKNVYYDIQYDTNSGKHYPRQIKNAEFVLIPKLLAKYKEDGVTLEDDSKQNDLYKLYKLMTKYDIGQLNTAETSKAAQRNIITLWDNNGVANFDEFEKNIKKKYPIENYYYQYLYKQQDIVSHMSDTENKAGIQIMKKILDNYSTATEKIKSKIDNIQDAYSSNIANNFKQFLFNMGWRYRDGKIINYLTDEQKEGLSEKDIDRKEKTLDFTEFYAKARYEAQRLGLDKNVLDFLFPSDDTKDTELPKYMNNISTVLENIAQSIFNNRIIRQTLPGWHAVQVTQIGYDNTLKYRPNDENIMEIKIAPWSKYIRNMIKEKGEKATIEYLEKEGLDKQVLYRIPTEGPQSMIVGKIVGFVPDIYDSTIIVPNEWVTQSGSDFDVDTIYNIRHEINQFGQKVKFNDQIPDEILYEKYVKNIIRKYKEDSDDIYENSNNKLKEIDDKINDYYTRLKQQKEYGKLKYYIDNFFRKGSERRLPAKTINAINKIRTEIKNNNPEYTIPEINYYSSLRFDEIDKDNLVLKLLKELYAAQFALESNDNSGISFGEIKTKDVKELLENARKERLDIISSIANRLQLISFDDFKGLNKYDKMTEQQRNTEIVENMIDIILDPSFNEGMLGRSNFDELTESKNKNEKLAGIASVKRSVYNPLDQNRFMQNAIDGRKLKAFSVNRDTLNSINGKLETTLRLKYEIRVIYSGEEYNKDYIKENFDTREWENGTLVVRHNQLGWSKKNRNIIGRLLIPYSSQTTAHILDAIKEGALINENDYTFGTFKTLLDVGIDTDTAIAWLMQPGISLINEYYNNNNSMFSKSYGNYQTNALRNIAIRLRLPGIKEKSTKKQILAAFFKNPHAEKVLKRYGIFKDDYDVVDGKKVKIEYVDVQEDKILSDKLGKANIPIIKEDLKDRLGKLRLKEAEELYEENRATKEELDSINEEYLILDFINVLQFDRIHKVSDKIEKLGRVLRPESSGIKKSVRGTREFKRNVDKYKDFINPINEYLNASEVLNKIYSEDSQYKYLNAFYEYGIKQSVDINSKLFETESPLFIELTDEIQAAIGHDLSDEQYDVIKKAIINNIYSGLYLINSPITINESGFVFLDTEQIEEDKDIVYWETEKGRINGYIVSEDSNIEISEEEFNNPSQEFINKFIKFTPVQKINFIKSHLVDSGVFEYLDTRMNILRELKNQGYSQNRIFFNDTSSFIDDVYNEFEQAFYSKNPLIRLTAIDLIKYAFVVEGYNYKKGSISKIIPNRILLADLKTKGLSIIDEIKNQFDLSFVGSRRKEIIENVIRANSNLITPIKLDDESKNTFNKYKGKDLFVILPFNDETRSIRSLINTENRDYVVIKYNEGKRVRSQLYKIETIRGYGNCLIPLNKLDANETSEDSINPKNNNPGVLQKMYYDELVDIYKNMLEEELTKENISKEELESEEYDKQLMIIKEFDVSGNEAYKHLIGSNSLYAQVKYDKTRALSAKIDKNILIRELKNAQSTNNKGVERTINHFFNSIYETLESPFVQYPHNLVLNNSTYLKSLLGIKKGKSVIVSIPYGDTTTEAIISYYSPNYFNKRIKNSNTYNKKKEVHSLEKELQSLYFDKWERAGYLTESISPTIYKIEWVPSEDELIQSDYEEIENAEEQEYNSIFESIKDALGNERVRLAVEENVELSTYLANAIKNDSKKEIDEFGLAHEYLSAFRQRNINLKNPISIKANTKTIYELSLNYYRDKAANLSRQFDNYTLSNGEEYSIDDLALYENLNDEDFNNLCRFLLISKTFGQSVEFLRNIPHKGEDEKTTTTIDEILKVTSSVSENPKLNKAFSNIFNYYIGKYYSTNPLIRSHILNLTDNFGDIDKISKWIVSPLETPHKQVQTIVKILETNMNKAMFRGKEAVVKFEQKYKELVDKGVDVNKLIDDQFRLIRPYTDKFTEDLEKFENNLEEIGEKYGYGSEKYFVEKLKYDKWRLKNLHQYLPDRFYESKIDIEEEAYNKGKDIFIKYRDLKERIRTFEINDELDEEQQKLFEELVDEVGELLNEDNVDGTQKSEEELEKIDAVKEYQQNIAQLYHKYFKTKEDKTWKRTLDYTLNTIKVFNVEHPDLTNEEKLEYKEYKVAYDWLLNNTYRRLNSNTRRLISSYFSLLKSHKFENESSELKKIKTKHKEEGNLYDAFGEIVGTVFTDEEVDSIKKELDEKLNDPIYSEDSKYSDSILINDAEESPALKDEFYETFISDKEELSESVQKEKRRIITEINDILGRGISKETGHLDFDLLYSRCTTEELDDLIQLYAELKQKIFSLRKDTYDADYYKDKPFYRKINSYAWGKQYLKYRTYDKTKQYYFRTIFAQTDNQMNVITDKKGRIKANPLIYGSISLKTDNFGNYLHPEYIDTPKNEAKKFINNNIEYKTTKYYSDAIRKINVEAENAKQKALNEGKSEKEATEIADKIINDWFNKNHTYNKYAHKYEPLPIWTKIDVKDTSKLSGEYKYYPSDRRNEIKEPKEINAQFKHNSYNYRTDTGSYNNSKYNFTLDEEEMYHLLESNIQQYSNERTDYDFLKEGYVPRMFKADPNFKYYANQVASIFGLQSRNYRDREFKHDIDFVNDSPIKNPMMDVLKAQGYQPLEKYKEQGTLSDEEYLKYRKEVDERNKEIKKQNRELEKAVIDKDWLKVFTTFIYNANMNQERERCKDLGYLTVEDLKSKKSYYVNNFDNVITSKFTNAPNLEQENILAVFQNYLRKLIYTDFKELHKLVPVADTLQNISSSRYMILNVLGGFANINTGTVNILGESFAKDYFGNKEYSEAIRITMAHQFNFIRDAFNREATSKWSAFAKWFDVVEPDAKKQQAVGENKFNVKKEFEKVNTYLYSFQSGGEFMMQNTVLFAMIKSHRVYQDIYTGKMTVGNINDYLQNIDYLALRKTIEGNSVYEVILEELKYSINKDKNRSKDYDKLKRNLSQEFFRSIEDKKVRNDLINKYADIRKEYVKQGTEEFNNLPKLEDQYTFNEKTGYIERTPNSLVTEDINAYFKDRVFSVNQKIHGVYDKIGAGLVETKWFGSLVMQYHKHIYPGIMKRWRTNGYYNELRGSFEKGSYISLIQWIFSDFKNYKDNLAKNKENHTNINAIESIRTVMQCIVNSLIDLNINWKSLPLWEQRNISRVKGDLAGVAASWLLSFLIYLMWDDDEIKENNTIGSCLYLIDRLLTETIMYTPTGMISEAKVLYRSPVAGAGGIEDIFHIMKLTGQYLFDDDFNPYYDRGTYKGMNKFGVTILKGTPIARQILRFSTMGKSNNYYRVGENNVSNKLIKNIVRNAQEN